MKNKGNAKSKYSKQLILKALLDILEDKKIDEITIVEICDYAMVSRKTFYRNFNTKIDILDDEASKFIETYLLYLSETDDLSFSNISALIFELVSDNLLFIQKLTDNNLTYLIFDKLLPKIINTYKVRKSNLFDEFGEATIENLLTFSFGGFENYIKKWIKDKNRMSLKQVNTEFLEMTEIFYLSNQIKGR